MRWPAPRYRRRQSLHAWNSWMNFQCRSGLRPTLQEVRRADDLDSGPVSLHQGAKPVSICVERVQERVDRRGLECSLPPLRQPVQALAERERELVLRHRDAEVARPQAFAKPTIANAMN